MEHCTAMRSGRRPVTTRERFVEGLTQLGAPLEALLERNLRGLGDGLLALEA